MLTYADVCCSGQDAARSREPEASKSAIRPIKYPAGSHPLTDAQEIRFVHGAVNE